MKKNWLIKDKPDPEKVTALAAATNIDPYLALLLVQRGVTDREEANRFFKIKFNHLHDPMLMKDMDKAVQRLAKALENKERILIYGDYDVDGTTSVAMMVRFLRQHSQNIEFYIPDRYAEGYGVSEAGIDWAITHKVDLIISMDCGIKANKTVARARENDIDFIICDHHTPGEELPPATAVLDPKQEGCAYPYKELSGCGVGFKLLQGLTRHYDWEDAPLYNLLDLVAVSIAADIVPITGENRVLCHFGLRKLDKAPNTGLAAIIKAGALKKPLNVTGVVFGIAPRINAAGRIEHANQAVEILLTNDAAEAELMAGNINKNNVIRKEEQEGIVAEALAMIEKDGEGGKSAVLFKEDWHKGVIGIVASKCIEHFYRPTIILTESNGMATGSARSVSGFDVHEAIGACSELLEQFGGHKYAAGLTLKKENVEAFRQKFEEVVSQKITEEQLTPAIIIDEEIDLGSISKNFMQVIDRMEPFGPGNRRPVFITRNLKASGARLLKNEHLKMEVVNEDGVILDAIGFYMAEYLDLVAKPFDLAYTLEMNKFRGQESIQLMIKDIKPAQ